MRIRSVVRRAAHAFSADECSTRAAALAYYAVFSLPPVLLIIIYVAGLKYGQAAAAGHISSHLVIFGRPAGGPPNPVAHLQCGPAKTRRARRELNRACRADLRRHNGIR